VERVESSWRPAPRFAHDSHKHDEGALAGASVEPTRSDVTDWLYRWCGRKDSNLHGVATASPSSCSESQLIAADLGKPGSAVSRDGRLRPFVAAFPRFRCTPVAQHGRRCRVVAGSLWRSLPRSAGSRTFVVELPPNHLGGGSSPQGPARGSVRGSRLTEDPLCDVDPRLSPFGQNGNAARLVRRSVRTLAVCPGHQLQRASGRQTLTHGSLVGMSRRALRPAAASPARTAVRTALA